MPVENVIVETDSAGNGKFETGKLSSEGTIYDFVVAAENVEAKYFGGADTINKIAENKWEGHVEDYKGAVQLLFEGLKSLEIEKSSGSETDIRFVVNRESKGKRRKFKIEAVMDRPAPLGLIRVYILSAKPRLLPHQKVLIVHRPLPGPLSTSPVRKGAVE